MISIQFLKLVLISLLIALPLAWLVTKAGLSIQHQIQISPLTFNFCIECWSLVALVTIGYHTVKAAVVNPVKSLRTE